MPPETNEEVKPKNLEIFEDILSASPFGTNGFTTEDGQNEVLGLNEKFIESCRWPTARLRNYTDANFYGIWLARVHKYRLFFSKCDFTTRFSGDNGQRLENYKRYWDYSLYCTQDRILREFLESHSPDDLETYFLFKHGLDYNFRCELPQLKLMDEESQLGDFDSLIARCTEEVEHSIELKKSNRENLPTLEGVASSTFWHDPDNIPESYRHQKELEEAIDNEYILAKKAELGIG